MPPLLYYNLYIFTMTVYRVTNRCLKITHRPRHTCIPEETTPKMAFSRAHNNTNCNRKQLFFVKNI